MLLREYETIYILRPDMPEDGMAQVNDRLSGILEREGAKLLKQDIWGKKKLAFEVKKHPKGVYVHLNYLSKPDVIREIERNLRLLEPVLSYQTIKVADDVDVDARMAEQEAENQARAAAEAQRKAEAEARRLEEEEAASFHSAPAYDAEDDSDQADNNDSESESPEADETDSPEEE